MMSLSRKPALDWKVCIMQVAKNDVPQNKTNTRLKCLFYASS